MPTNRISLKTSEEFMSGYTPIYQPIYPLFLGSSQQYDSEVGVMDFRHVRTVGDVRSKRITPKDTEIKQIQVTDDKKSFKKYFLANQFQQSLVQNREGAEDVVAQVLDEHQAQFDELFLFGDSGLNNGLFTSTDANYVLETSIEIKKNNFLDNLYSAIVTTAEDANVLGGNKVLFIYGDDMMAKYNGKFTGSDKPFSAVLAEGLGNDYSVVKIPKSLSTGSGNGWMIANIDQVKMHFTKLPELLSQGYNEEKMYYWHNFMTGSVMLEVKAKGGITRQPITFEA